MALIDHEDIARLFRGLVDVLATEQPTRLRQGFDVAELYQELIPYRLHRNRLGFATNQDYESAILGLLAGIGGYATVHPVEAQETLAAEAASPNPDPTLFREFSTARVHLTPSHVDAVLAGEGGYAPPPDPGPPAAPPTTPPPTRPPAPPAPVFELAPEEAAATAAPAARPAGRRAAPACTACGAALPAHRPVVYCPFCGKPVGGAGCERCGDELIPAWQFCPRCGHPRKDGA